MTSKAANAQEGSEDAIKGNDSMQLFEKQMRAQLGDEAFEAMNADSGNGVAEEVAPESLSLNERLKSTKWEFRVHALNELKEKYEASQQNSIEIDLTTHANSFQVWLCDRNVNAQKAALECIVSYFDKCSKQDAQSLWPTLAPVIFEKCIVQAKLLSSIVNLMANALSVLEAALFQEPITALLDKFIDKKGNAAVRGPPAKQMTGLLNTLEKLMRLFGASKLQITEILSRVPKYAAVTDNSVKQAAYGVLQELFVWTRNTALITTSVPEKQRAELERRCAQITEQRPEPIKMYRVDRALGDSKGTGGVPSKEIDGTNNDIEETRDLETELYDMLPEIDISKLIDAEEWEKSITNAEKWKDKQSAYELLTRTCEKSKKIKTPVELNVFISTCVRTIQTEGNLVVVTTAIKACVALATSLRKNLISHSRQLASIAIGKLKDRSKPVIVAVLALLDALLLCSPFDNFLDELSKAATDKNPQTRENALNWCLQALEHRAQKEHLHKFAPKALSLAIEAIDDSAPAIRHVSASILTHLLTHGPKPELVKRAIENLPAKKKQTAEEVLARCNRKNKPDDSGALEVTPAFDAKRLEPPKIITTTKPSGPIVSNKSKAVKLKVNASSDSTTSRQPVAKDEPLDEIVMDAPVAEERVLACVDDNVKQNIIPKLKEKGWQARQSALMSLGEWCEHHSDQIKEAVDAFAIFLKVFGTNEFKESNFNVNKAAMETVEKLCKAGGVHFTKSCATIFLKGYGDKIADVKIGPSFKSLVDTFSIHFSPKFVLAVLFSVVEKVTNPKVHSEVCNLVEKLVTDFGICDVDIGKILEFAKGAIEKKLPATRSAAIKLLVLLYRYLGENLNRLLGTDLKQSIKDEIQSTCNKSPQSPPQPTKQCRLTTAQSLKNGTATKSSLQRNPEQIAEELIEQQVPRVSIQEFLTPQLYKDLIDPKWKVRKESAIAIQKLLKNEGKMHITPAGIGELLAILRSRIQQDPNRPTIKEILIAVGMVGESLGPLHAKQFSKSIIPTILHKFSDKTPPVRESCLSANQNWFKSCGGGIWFNCLASCQILNGGTEEKETTLGFLSSLTKRDYLSAKEGEGKAALESLIGILFGLYQDKSKTVRSHTEKILLIMAELFPPNVFNKEFKNTKSSNQAALRPLLNQILNVAAGPQQQETPIEGESHDIMEEPAVKQKLSSSLRSNALPSSNSNPDGFVVKLAALNSVSALNRLEAYKKTKWSPTLTNIDLETLSGVWKPFLNDPLHTAMFEGKTPLSKLVKAFEFWKSVLNNLENFESICSNTDIVELLLKWIVLRLCDHNNKVVMAASDLLLYLVECLTAAKPDPQMHEALLNCVLPQLIERAGVVTTSQSQMKEQQQLEFFMSRIHQNSLQRDCFYVFMKLFVQIPSLLHRTTSSLRAVCIAIEELAELILRGGPAVCLDLQRDVAKLCSLSMSGLDAAVKDAAIKALASLYPYLTSSLFELLASVSRLSTTILRSSQYPDVQERVATFLENHPELSQPRVDLGAADNSKSDHEIIVNSRNGSDGNPGNPKEKENEVSNEPKEIVIKNELGLKDYSAGFEYLMEDLGFETILKTTQSQLEQYARDIYLQEVDLYHQDLNEEWRRLWEGKSRPNEYDISYLNGKLRLEEATRGDCLSLRFLEEIRKLVRPDAVSIAEGSVRLTHLLDQPQTDSDCQPDWQSTFASELVTGVSIALSVCFDPERSSQSESERDMLCAAAQKLTTLINKLVKNKKTLHRISPGQLTTLFKNLLSAMSCHGTWSGCVGEEVMVKRLNSIVASHIMAIITPRNASSLVGMMIDFLLDGQCQLDTALTLRVHRKLIKKLNSKHLTNLTDQEKQYYLRILDTAIISLMRIDGHPVLSHIQALTDIPNGLSQNAFDEDFTDASKLKAQLEMLIKELVFMAIVVLGPKLAGVYFRDIGYFMLPANSIISNRLESTESVTQIKPAETTHPRAQRLNRFFRERFESLMNTEFTPVITATICPNILQTIDPIRPEERSYQHYHEWFVQHHTELKTPPVLYPEFSFNRMIDQAAKGITLADCDRTLAAGWAARRETRAGTDIRPAHDLLHVRKILDERDVVALEFQNWKRTLIDIQKQSGIDIDVNEATTNARTAVERGLVPNELIGQYVRKTIAICTDCGIIGPDPRIVGTADSHR